MIWLEWSFRLKLNIRDKSLETSLCVKKTFQMSGGILSIKLITLKKAGICKSRIANKIKGGIFGTYVG